MSNARPTKVYPIPGRWAVGHAPVVRELPSKKEAEELVSTTGVYALSQSEADEQAYTTPEATPADDSNVKQPPAEVPADEAPAPEAPADAPEAPAPEPAAPAPSNEPTETPEGPGPAETGEAEAE
jgi:hypothetical protein